MGFKRFLKNKLVLMAAAGLMALGLVGGAGLIAAGAAYGHGAGSGFGAVNDFAGRVAQKLNAALGLTEDQEISAAQMQTAFNAATADLQEEHLQQKLDDAEVAAAEADAIMDWFRAWPYAELIRLRPIGFADNADRLTRKLAHLVEKEWITQAQSDGIVSLGTTTGRNCRRAWNGRTGAATGVKAAGTAAMPAAITAAAIGTGMAPPPVSADSISTDTPQFRGWGRDTTSRPHPL